MPIVPRKARTIPAGEVRASWPAITGTSPHRATRPVDRPTEVRRVGLPVCGHPLTPEAQVLYRAWDPAPGESPPQWLCPVCKDWRSVNVYPDGMIEELLY